MIILVEQGVLNEIIRQRVEGKHEVALSCK